MPDLSPDSVFLPCRSRRQAADWSLALISQGIESELARTDQGWGLLLDAVLADEAKAVITQYRRENRHWYRYFQTTPDSPGFHPGVFLWALLLVGVHVGSSLAPLELRAAGMTDTEQLLDGQYWRLWTSVSLHADLRHLIGNLTFGTLLLGFAMARFGGGWAQLVALLCGVVGNIVSAAVHGLDHHGLGASGMVMAALGMLAVGSVQPGQAGVPFRAWLFRSVLGAALLFVLIGLDPGSDVVAHAAGFAAGGAAGVLLNAMPTNLRTSPRANHLAALLALAMLVAAWSAAMVRS
jgi:membrane associated rhomboid family serine protease